MPPLPEPLVSVITPCYNSERFIAATIASVRRQTLTAWEHIVVDDGSTDESAKQVEALLPAEPRLRLIRQSNGGVCRARNAGYAASSPQSEFLLFLDADDCLVPEMLATMTDYLRAHPQAGMVFCSHISIDAEDRTIPDLLSMPEQFPRYVPSGFGLRCLRPEEAETPFVSVYAPAGIIPSLAVLRRAVYQQTPGYDEMFGQHYEDTDLFLQIAIRSRIHYLPRPLVQYRRHSAQNTADAGRFGNQQQKLYAKWAAMPALTPAQRQIVAEAERFRSSRLIPYQGIQAGTRHLLRGEIGLCLRFYIGAARRYFLPKPPSTLSPFASA